MDPTCAALLASAKDDPDGPARLVLADWLTENDQEPRAELIRVQHRLTELDEHDPARTGLLEQERALVAAHAPGWLGWLAAPPWNGAFRRGLLRLSCDHPDECVVEPWTEHFESAAEWLESVELRNGGSAEAFGAFLAHSALRRATDWDFSPLAMRPEHLRSLADADFPFGVVSLGLGGCEFTVALLKRLASSPWFPQLKHLDAGQGAPMDPRQVELLLATGTGSLRTLNLRLRALEPEVAWALAGSPGVAGFERLVLSNNPLGAAGARLLATGNFAGLRRLELAHNGIGDSGLAALLAAPWIAGATHLSLRGNSITESGAQLLAESPNVAHLAHLDLADNLIRDAGLHTLARSPHLAGLTSLDVGTNYIGNEGAAALARSGTLTGLRVLGLSQNKLGSRGGQALAASPILDGLAFLDLHRNAVGSRAKALLTAKFGSRVSFGNR